MAEYPNYLTGVPDGHATGVASIIGPGVTKLGGALYLANAAGGNAQPLTTALVTNPIAVASNVITSPTLPSNQGAHMRIIFVGRSDTSAETDTLTIQFNADTAAHYDSTYTQVSHATVSGVNASAGATTLTLGTIAAASATAGIPGVAIIDVPLFHGTTFQKQLLFACGYQDIATAAADVINAQGIGTWRSAAAITSFKLAAGTGNLIAGSVAYVYSS
jgi:hypothetical protein